MRKQEFIEALEDRLSGLPQAELDKHLDDYSRLIIEQVSEGVSETDAVAELGNVESCARQILSEVPLWKILKERIVNMRRPKTWQIVLLALSAVIWLPLLLICLAVVLCIYSVAWIAILAAWAVQLAMGACALAGLVLGVMDAVRGEVFRGIVLIAAGVFCVGLSLFVFIGCRSVTRAGLRTTKKLTFDLKNLFSRRKRGRKTA